MSGYRTYICAFVIACTSAAVYLGYIDQMTGETIVGLFLGGGLAFLRKAVN
jgi:hypothetical protein